MRNERKLAARDRVANGQFSCDTGLSRPVRPLSKGRGGSAAHRLLGDGLRNAVRSSLRRALPRGGARIRAGIDNESDQVP